MYKELFWDFVKDHKLLFTTVIILLLLVAPFEVIVIPSLYGKLLSNPGKKNDQVFNNFRRLIIIIVVCWIVVQVLVYSSRYLVEKIKLKYQHYYKILLFSRLVENYETNFKDVSSASTTNKILHLSDKMVSILNFVFTYFIPLFFFIVFIIIYLFIIDWKIGLTGLILFFLIVAVFVHFSKKIVELAATKEMKYDEMNDQMNNSIDNLMNVYLNNQKTQEISKLKGFQEKYDDWDKKMTSLVNKLGFWTAIVAVGLFGTILGMAFHFLKKNHFTFDKFITIALILTYFLGYLINLADNSPEELEKLGIVMYSNSFVKEILKPKRKNYLKNMDLDGNIEMKNIYYQYDPNSSYIFDDFSFKIMKHRKTAILGPSGSGKSTLMKLMLGLNQPQQGNIFINGFKVKDINPEHLRNNINYINQRTGMFSGSVVDNIKYGNEISDKEVETILVKYDLVKNFKGLPKGIYNDVGSAGKALSGGMQKIIMNIRGALKKGKIMIFDEPLAGLDEATRKKMIKLIIDLTQGKTLVVITHDKEILPFMDEVVYLKKINS